MLGVRFSSNSLLSCFRLICNANHKLLYLATLKHRRSRFEREALREERPSLGSGFLNCMEDMTGLPEMEIEPWISRLDDERGIKRITCPKPVAGFWSKCCKPCGKLPGSTGDENRQLDPIALAWDTLISRTVNLNVQINSTCKIPSLLQISICEAAMCGETDV